MKKDNGAVLGFSSAVMWWLGGAACATLVSLSSSCVHGGVEGDNAAIPVRSMPSVGQIVRLYTGSAGGTFVGVVVEVGPGDIVLGNGEEGGDELVVSWACVAAWAHGEATERQLEALVRYQSGEVGESRPRRRISDLTGEE
jgi:hypothetical protein